VDGVANKQADVAWVSATDEKAARFASAQAVHWIECYACFAQPRQASLLVGVRQANTTVGGVVVGFEHDLHADLHATG
jgi:hypothetical protein